jgi:hypothetical protein
LSVAEWQGLTHGWPGCGVSARLSWALYLFSSAETSSIKRPIAKKDLPPGFETNGRPFYLLRDKNYLTDRDQQNPATNCQDTRQPQPADFFVENEKGGYGNQGIAQTGERISIAEWGAA